MIQKVDLNDNRNLFVVSVILIAGVGGMSLKIGPVLITEVACALILGILTNLLVHAKKPAEEVPAEATADVAEESKAEEAPKAE